MFDMQDANNQRGTEQMLHLTPPPPAYLRAEEAVEFIIKDATVTYPAAAERYGVTVNEIRARINYRWGSLRDARDLEGAYPAGQPAFMARWCRPCICCGSTELRPRGRYLCNSCTIEDAVDEPERVEQYGGLGDD